MLKGVWEPTMICTFKHAYIHDQNYTLIILNLYYRLNNLHHHYNVKLLVNVNICLPNSTVSSIRARTMTIFNDRLHPQHRVQCLMSCRQFAGDYLNKQMNVYSDSFLPLIPSIPVTLIRLQIHYLNLITIAPKADSLNLTLWMYKWQLREVKQFSQDHRAYN